MVEVYDELHLINGEGLGCEGAPPEDRSPKLGDPVSQDQEDPHQSVPKVVANRPSNVYRGEDAAFIEFLLCVIPTFSYIIKTLEEGGGDSWSSLTVRE